MNIASDAAPLVTGDPVVATPTPEALQTAGERLAQVVHEGQRTMPQERPVLVCKPQRVEAWRIFKIMSEFVEGFDLIRRYGLAATFFGSARAALGDDMYDAATRLAAALSHKGFAVITGGSAGIMQAANKGAFEAGGESVGLNVHIADGQTYNPYLTDKFAFDHFFVRKVMLVYAAEVYIFFPGGFGTLDEFFEVVTLVQTKKIRKVPIILFNKAHWEPLISFIEKSLYEQGLIDEGDTKLYKIVDTVDEALAYITDHVSC